MKIIENKNNKECCVKDVQCGWVVKFDDVFYIVTDAPREKVNLLEW